MLRDYLGGSWKNKKTYVDHPIRIPPINYTKPSLMSLKLLVPVKEQLPNSSDEESEEKEEREGHKS